jgi:hypothetical protein
VARKFSVAALWALSVLLGTAPYVLAQQQALYQGPESPTEKKFVVGIQHDLTKRFASAASAERVGYVRYTGVDDTGAISYANCQWTSGDPDHPSQLWYDRRGSLLGADYSVPIASSPSRPQLWGINPARWIRLRGHEHWVVRDPRTGALVYSKWMPDATFAAGGGNVNNPSAQTLVAMHKVAHANDVVHLFHFPAVWDLTVWVKPNPNGAFAEKNPTVSLSAQSPAPNGAHDFDFEFGAWDVQVARRAHPLTRPATWTYYKGTHVVYKVWNGQANYGVLELDGAQGHIEGMQTRLYNTDNHQWSLRFASSANGELRSPSVGRFSNGRGVFNSSDAIDGRHVMVRSVTSNITRDAYRDDIALSQDGGKTWSVYWIAKYTRARGTVPAPPANNAQGQQRAFDFEFGSWKAYLKRLLHPLSGSHQWTTYGGISVVHKIWNGRANLGEIDLHGPAGRLHGLSLRLYNPRTHKWSVYWANANGGSLTTPLVGGFHDGRGLFMDHETFNGHPIVARFVFTFASPRKFHIVQSFSPDSGRSWEPNWISTFTR